MSFYNVQELHALKCIQILPVVRIVFSFGQYSVILSISKHRPLLLCVRPCAGFWEIKVSVTRQGPALKELAFNT